MREWQRWVPAGILGFGCLLLGGVSSQRAMPLRAPLATLPTEFGPFRATEIRFDQEQERVAGMSTYIMRVFRDGADSLNAFSVYVGYYEQQTQGRTIHSPKNCLPGSGWEALQSSEEAIPVGTGPAPKVNRYLLTNRGQKALVLYWYQGRGRVAADEYQVKFDLLRDAALKRRSEEALVRIVVPITPARDDAKALALARRIAERLIPEVDRVLPT
ncbi:MAG: exosortase C-terminal domain/associated protein EpsI [Gemmatimonadota bacterium]